MRAIYRNLFLALMLLPVSAHAGQARTWIVCPEGATGGDCRFSGNSGIQAAVDSAADGDTILIRTGVYTPEAYRNVEFGDVIIPGYVLVEGKSVHIRGEAGTILDGAEGVPATAFVFHRADVTLEGLTIRNFHVLDREDDIYDGHGIFVVSSRFLGRDVLIQNAAKMAVSIRGTSIVDVADFRIVDGHMGFWLRENGSLSVRDTLVANNRGAGLASYDTSFAYIDNAVFDGNGDDGIYADEDAIIYVAGSTVTRNAPFGINTGGNGRIRVNRSFLYGNENELGERGIVLGSDMAGQIH